MFNFGIIFLAVDTVLMAGILAFIFLQGRRPKAAEAGTDRAALDGAVRELREELGGVKRLARELDRRRAAMEGIEASSSDRQRRLDELIMKAEEAIGALSTHPGVEYTEAIGMLKKGAAPEELTGRLGLLKGEAELLSNIVKYNC